MTLSRGACSSSLAGVCRYACSLPLSMRKQQCGSTLTIPTSGSARSNSGSSAPRTRRSEGCSTKRAAPAVRRSPPPPDRALRRALLRPGALPWRSTGTARGDAPRDAGRSPLPRCMCGAWRCLHRRDGGARRRAQNVVGPHRFEVLASVSHGISEQAPELLGAPARPAGGAFVTSRE